MAATVCTKPAVWMLCGWVSLAAIIDWMSHFHTASVGNWQFPALPPSSCATGW